MGIKDAAIGLYRKFIVQRTDASDEPGGKHHNCDYFVLDLTHDKHAPAAISAYADSCEAEYPLLARDLRSKVDLDTRVQKQVAAEELERLHTMTLHDIKLYFIQARIKRHDTTRVKIAESLGIGVRTLQDYTNGSKGRDANG